MKPVKLSVIHYSTIELFPPVLNLLNILSGMGKFEITVYTIKNIVTTDLYVHDKIRIVRFPAVRNEQVIVRLLKYFYFNIGVFIKLIASQPDKILYYETYSSYPVYLYKRFINSRVPVFIHCHEYFSPEWWKNVSMKLMRYYYKKELEYLYPRAKWISHTNAQRLELFLKDTGLPNDTRMHVFPNYPPASWKREFAPREADKKAPVRFVCVGSFGSLETLYIREILDWCNTQGDTVLLDIYSIKVPGKIKKMIDELPSANVRLKGSVNYFNLPEVLNSYDVGLILYKATTLNVIYSVSNKLYEYLVCGLDVWYSKEIISTHSYDCSEWPKVVRVDFANLQMINLECMMHVKNKHPREIEFKAEDASREIIDNLTT